MIFLNLNLHWCRASSITLFVYNVTFIYDEYDVAFGEYNTGASARRHNVLEIKVRTSSTTHDVAIRYLIMCVYVYRSRSNTPGIIFSNVPRKYMTALDRKVHPVLRVLFIFILGASIRSLEASIVFGN